ncbi:conserved hypothetical protein [Ricinus communis]|uniref:Uncharacterized protein n=1 Tax=Ricinus communis TaxID=3988 RepID=B9RWL6_RICCO|nr:conserved hypothetical protein [Ricinus communis]
MPKLDQCDVFLVADLVDKDGLNWDVNKVRQLFSEAYQKRILKIVVGPQSLADEKVWHKKMKQAQGRLVFGMSSFSEWWSNVILLLDKEFGEHVILARLKRRWPLSNNGVAHRRTRPMLRTLGALLRGSFGGWGYEATENVAKL